MVNGNCKTTYNGGQWGYITDEAARNGDCPDARSSKQFQGGQWSYFSCTTSSTRQCVCSMQCVGWSQLCVLDGEAVVVSSSAFNSRVNVKSSFRPSDASSSDPSSP
ncbi:unnamed protein product [Lepeophtheirus salmonis]|uniref:(salmon louse) hypothetical protein n=1 Tax=Lepeophtheirus salmonis TaxID=72036 RepID=A0A7R8D5V3_LEPSM|nr:unnamed protein product [Lepeophtheirus salmonis]CAF3039100.1 unnamed protein product [Lepeophtheirus salmonis]